MYIEVIALENFSAVPKEYIKPSSISRQRHAVFHFFYLTKIDFSAEREKVLTT